MNPNERKKRIMQATLTGSVVNLLLLVFKFAAGIFGRSSAMIADAVHSLSDFATDLVVLICIRVSSKPRDEEHQYGHGKFETLATAIIGIVLFGVGLKLMWDGGERIVGYCFRGETLASPGLVAFIAALLSIALKEALYRYTMRVGRETESQTVVANAWHHRSDALSSIGTALGIGGAIVLGPKWNVLDPIAAILVSMLILRVAVKLIGPAMNELLEKSLPAETEAEIREIITTVPGVTSPHNLRTRRVGRCVVIETHIRVADELTVVKAHRLTKVVEERLRARFGPDTLINLHVEPMKPTHCSA